VKSVWLQRAGRSQVIVFFAGWAMDDRPFRHLTSRQYDVNLCYDYRDLPTTQDASSQLDDNAMANWAHVAAKLWSDYRNITIVAWSFGCAVAAQVLAHTELPIRNTLAINGTVVPDDARLGIPARWLDATAAKLTTGGWEQFVRRMCSNDNAYGVFAQSSPARDLPGAVNELERLRSLPPPPKCGFQRALIGTGDKIIRPTNQQRCWSRYNVPAWTLAAPHYPFHLWTTWEDMLAVPRKAPDCPAMIDVSRCD